MDEKKIQNFLEWLPTKFEEFKGKSLEEVAEDLNRLYETDEGKQTIQTLMNTFLEEQDKNSSKFANGGILPTSKLDYIVSLHKKGSKLKTKKCSCGCEMHKVLENGGVVEKCACGCDTKKIVKAEKGTEVKENKSKTNYIPYQPGLVGTLLDLIGFDWGFNRAKETKLPKIVSGPTRTYKRVVYSPINFKDRIITPNEGYVERQVIVPDTSFKRIADPTDIAVKPHLYKKGSPEYDFYQQRWEEYGVK